MTVNRIIWSWSDADDRASDLALTLEGRNPGWSVRVLSEATIGRYVDLSEIWPDGATEAEQATAVEVLKLALLHEFGGVWIEEGLELLESLDDWTGAAASRGFFAFADAAGLPSPDLLVAEEGNSLVASWLAATLARVDESSAGGPEWLSRAFRAAADGDPGVGRTWRAVPRLPLRSSSSDITPYSSTAPVTRVSEPRVRDRRRIQLRTELSSVEFAGLSLTTPNAGDNIQIIAMEHILRRLGLVPSLRLDRDRDLAGGEWLRDAPERLPILINGWMMHEPAAWPPHPSLDATLFGVFFKVNGVPSLIGEEALRYYAAHPAVGCRDPFTMNLLKSRGIDAYLSHCVTMGFPRRLPDAAQKETFVVAPDEKLLSALKDDPGFTSAIGDNCVSLSHYPGSVGFEANHAVAHDLLDTYRSRAGLVVTSMLHCALPAIAMGIPVVCLSPIDMHSQADDVVRLGDLARFVRVFDGSELDQVDWSGYRVDLGELKFEMVERIKDIVSSWRVTEDVKVNGTPVNEPAVLTDGEPIEDHAPQRQVPLPTSTQALAIPKVFHRVWLGGGEMPEEYVRFGQTWLDHHPGWEMRTWSEGDLSDLVNQKYFDDALNYAEKSDFARYEILQRHGGVYMDTDVECLANIEPLLKGIQGFIGKEQYGWLGSAVVGAVPGHPFINRLVSSLPKSYDNHRRVIGGDPKWYAQSARCGPVFVTREYIRARAQLPDEAFRACAPDVFYPTPDSAANGDGGPGSVSRHHFAGSWLPERDNNDIYVPAAAPETISIPKVFHRVWLGGPMPEDVRRLGETWLAHHPGWTMKTWGYDDLRDLINQSHFDTARNYAEQSDFARYEILLRHGGVYLDTDFECRKSIEPLLSGITAFAASEDNLHVCGGIIGAVPNHPFIKELIERLPGSYASYPEPGDQSERCGPIFVTRMFQDAKTRAGGHPPLEVYPPEYFYPYLWWEKERVTDPAPEAYALHHWDGSWLRDDTAVATAGTASQGVSAPARDIVLLLADDNPQPDWSAVAGVAHLLVGTGAKLTIAAPPDSLTEDFVDYLREVDERLGGVVDMEVSDADVAVDDGVGLLTTVPDAFEAVCDYLRLTDRAWLPVHSGVVLAAAEAVAA